MRIGFIADAVELEICVTQAGFRGFFGELRALGELDPVGRGLYALIADLAAVADGLQKMRGKRRLAARKLNRQLAPRLNGDRVIQQRLDFFPGQLMYEAYLVGIHE